MRFLVTKYFGHFCQTWSVEAATKEEAWDRAETGRLVDIHVVKKTYNAPGYVIHVDKRIYAPDAVPEEQYYEWLEDAVNKGMKLTPLYQRILDNWQIRKTNK